MKRLGAIFTALAVAVGLLMAPPSSAATQTLVVWATGDDASTKVTAAAAKVFMRSNPGVKVTVQTIGWGDGYAKVLAAAAAKKGPDVITGGLSWGISLGQKGALADLRPLGVASFVQPKVPAQIYRSLIAYGSTKVYAVPYDLTLMMMFYDTRTLADAGIAKAPTTIAEFNTAAQKMADAGIDVPVYNEWGNADWLGWFNWLYSSGGSLYNSKCQVTINNAKGINALNQYKKLYDDYGALKPGVADWSMNDNLKNKKYGFGFSGNFQASSLYTFYRDYKTWNAAPVPKASASGKSISFIGGRGISIMKYSKKQALAAKFIKSLYNINTVTAMNSVGTVENSIFLSPVVSFADTIASYPSTVLKTIKSQLSTAQGPPNCIGWEDSQADVTKQIQDFLFDGKSAKAALDAAAAAMKSRQK